MAWTPLRYATVRAPGLRAGRRSLMVRKNGSLFVVALVVCLAGFLVVGKCTLTAGDLSVLFLLG